MTKEDKVLGRIAEFARHRGDAHQAQHEGGCFPLLLVKSTGGNPHEGLRVEELMEDHLANNPPLNDLSINFRRGTERARPKDTCNASHQQRARMHYSGATKNARPARGLWPFASIAHMRSTLPLASGGPDRLTASSLGGCAPLLVPLSWRGVRRRCAFNMCAPT